MNLYAIKYSVRISLDIYLNRILSASPALQGSVKGSVVINIKDFVGGEAPVKDITLDLFG
jgi:hypothetical protein